MGNILRRTAAPAIADLSLAEACEQAEERERFDYFAFAVAAGSALMAVGYAVLGNTAVALTGLVLMAAMLAIRHWTLQEAGTSRLQAGVQLATSAGLLFILWQLFGLGEAVAGWYLATLPLGVAIFCGVRAGLVWVAISVGAILLTAWVTLQGHIPAGDHSTLPMVVITRGVLTLIITVFGVAARRSRDQHVQVLHTSLVALRQAQQEAERANEAKSSFLATMSHELRTPLNAVIGLNSLMLESQLPTLQQHQAELACQAGEAMLHIINEILDFSRIESGRLELDRTVFSPRQVMEESLALLAGKAAEKGLRLRSEIDVPLRLTGDATRLRQIVLNLLTNAVKFTPSGEVVLRCNEHPSGGAHWLFVEVRDTGIGIADAALARIFQPFEQADASTTRLYGGTGLGLAICRGLVAAMGGKLGVNSAPGMGSAFWFEIPFGTPAPGQEQLAPCPVASTGHSAPARILLAEDNSTNQFVALEMFRKLGHELHLVSNGQEAIAAARTQHFDLIFMDCNMPLADGFEAARTIRAQEPPGRRIPIVAMTALAYKSDRDKCLAAGMDDYLTKPVRLHDLSLMLGRWLPQRAPGDPTPSAPSRQPSLQPR
jgi:signal transduction histidine kinase/CheY-like chemotaxis protein